jgi:hypothetical protein
MRVLFHQSHAFIMIKKWLSIGLLGWVLLPWAQFSYAAAPAPDFTTTQGATAACAMPLDAAANLSGLLQNNAQRQVFVLCRDAALLAHFVKWVKPTFAHFQATSDYATLAIAVRKELTHVRNEIGLVRSVLEALKLQPGEGLMLAPGQWQFDLDGDGVIETWERSFFAIPKRNEQPFRLSMPTNDPDYYAEHYQAPEARFKVDQSDVLWALAYHQFTQGLLELVLAHQVNLPGGRFSAMLGDKLIELKDRPAMMRAHQLIGAGFTTSMALRASLLAETDDEDEWIANPKQKNTVFPLKLESIDYDNWGQFLSTMLPLWQGKTLLGMSAPLRGLFGGARAELCAPGKATSIPLAFAKWPRFALKEVKNNGPSQLGDCVKITPQRPKTNLVEMLQKASDTASPQAMRYLYWVN